MTVPASQLIRVFLAITHASEGIGRITSMAPDADKAQAAARSILSLLDTPLTSFDPISDAAGAEERAGAGRGWRGGWSSTASRTRHGPTWWCSRTSA